MCGGNVENRDGKVEKEEGRIKMKSIWFNGAVVE
jgi:hypothetical protein